MTNSLIWVHPFCSILKFVSNVRQLFAADDFSRRHFSDAFFLGALRVRMSIVALSLLVATFVVCWWPLQTVSTQIRPTKWSGSKLYDTESVPLRFFEIVNFEKSRQKTTKAWRGLLVSSVNDLCKYFEPRSGQQNVRPDPDPNCLNFWLYSQTNFSKKWILKKICRQQKRMQNYPLKD